jgi:hypothetical protein
MEDRTTDYRRSHPLAPLYRIMKNDGVLLTNVPVATQNASGRVAVEQRFGSPQPPARGN